MNNSGFPCVFFNSPRKMGCVKGLDYRFGGGGLSEAGAMNL